jgi:HSP20 family protein
VVERSHTAGWWPNLYEPLKRAGEKVAEWFAPRSEASRSPDSYKIALELPGVEADDIEIAVQEDSLIVSGEKRFERKEEGDSFFFSEREYGAFQRAFRLPGDANVNEVVADFKNGVLTITVPKAQTVRDDARRIPIRTA